MNAFRLLRADEIDCRISQVAKDGKWLDLLLYKDARCDMNILDETVGPFNWKREHSRDNANCLVSLWDEQKQQWIYKEDTGTESNTEAQKGLASDSFKRACFNWGIGRELYTAPKIRIWSDACTIVQASNGKLTCYDGFTVREITYNDKQEIQSLVIWNERRDSPAFSWTRGQEVKRPAPKATSAEPPSYPTTNEQFKPTCADCGTEIPDNVHDFAVKYYGMPLCRNCQKNHKRK